MLSAFTAYIKTIVVFLIFMAFAEIIMPNNKFRNYINIILGILMIVTILNPIQMLINKNDMDFSSLIKSKDYEVSKEYLKNKEKYMDKQNDLVIEIYKNNINNSISEALKNDEINVSDVKTEVNGNSFDNTYGSVEEISIKVSIDDFLQSEDGQVQPVIVNKVKEGGFGTEIKDENNSEFEVKQRELKRKIEEKLSKIYGLPSEKINVSLE